MSILPDSEGFWNERMGKQNLNLEALEVSLGRIDISLEQGGSYRRALNWRGA